MKATRSSISLRGMTKTQALDAAIDASVELVRGAIEQNFVDQQSPDWIREYIQADFEEKLPAFRAEVEARLREHLAAELATLH